VVVGLADVGALEIAERLRNTVVEDEGGSVIDVVLKDTGSNEVAVAEVVMDAVVDDDESTMLDVVLVVAVVLVVIGLVTVVDEEATVVGVVLGETGLENVVTILDPSW
jgi:hypothetical protein